MIMTIEKIKEILNNHSYSECSSLEIKKNELEKNIYNNKIISGVHNKPGVYILHYDDNILYVGMAGKLKYNSQTGKHYSPYVESSKGLHGLSKRLRASRGKYLNLNSKKDKSTWLFLKEILEKEKLDSLNLVFTYTSDQYLPSYLEALILQKLYELNKPPIYNKSI